MAISAGASIKMKIHCLDRRDNKMRSKANYIKWLLCALFLLAALCTAAMGKIIYVDRDAIEEFNGLEWAFAYQTLQDAIDNVQPG